MAWTYRTRCSTVRSYYDRKPWLQGQLDPDAVAGAADLPYAIPELRSEWVRQDGPVALNWWRGVGETHKVFVVESFLYELAHAAGQDPVAYRRALLGKNPRSLAVLNKAAQASGWGKPLPPRCARGISLHDSFGTHAALVMEGEVDTQGEIHLRRATAAVDCGIAVNLRQMIEARIERLSKDEQRVVEVASVVGVTFSAACVAAAAQMDEVDAEDVCEELSRRHLILRPVDSQRFAAGAVSPCWEFEHALYRKVLYERLGQGRRARVHRHVGER